MSHTDKLRIVVAETAPVVGLGLASCLRRLPGFEVHATEVHSYGDLIDEVRSSDPDLIVANPTFGGAFHPAKLRDDSGVTGFKVMAIEIGRLGEEALALYDGVIAVTDDLPTLAAKLRAVCHGSVSEIDEKDALSQREKEIVTLVVKGMTNKEIADKLFLSVHTVNTHRRNIARKLEIHSATGLTIYAIVNHLVDLSEVKL